MKVLHLDHIGVVVNDIGAAQAFFTDLGFKHMGQTTVEGEWVGKIIGLGYVKSDVVMMKAPDGQVCIELCKYYQPKAVTSDQTASNVLGLRHIAFVVEDLDGIVADLGKKGRKLVGEVYSYEDSWKLCYVHGPEGIIVELAERLQK